MHHTTDEAQHCHMHNVQPEPYNDHTAADATGTAQFNAMQCGDARSRPSQAHSGALRNAARPPFAWISL